MGSDRFVALAIAYCHDDGIETVPLSLVEAYAGVSLRTVKASISVLAKRGIITRIEGAGRGDQSRVWLESMQISHTNAESMQISHTNEIKYAKSAHIPAQQTASLPPRPPLSDTELINLTPPVPIGTSPKGAKRKSRFPDDFVLSNLLRTYAASKGVQDIDTEFEAFRDHHVAKGNLMLDWEAAWRTWCRNYQRFSANGRAEQRGQFLTFAERAEIAREREFGGKHGRDG